MTTHTFTRQQEEALTAFASRRLTVVRAGPGSGKTRVFVEAFRRELKNWNSTRAGIAALSFTNVAHEVISERMGGEPPAPHFVGTLDAFLLRFVVRPFGHLADVHIGGTRLVPDPIARALERPAVSYGPEPWEKASIYSFVFDGGDERAPRLSVRGKFGRPVSLDGTAQAQIFREKKRLWKNTGRTTHSDAQFIASSILHGEHGAKVLDIIARRFPVVLIDEFQDTGWFLGRAFTRILERVTRGLLVGDPDQAIYQFTGSDRRLFHRLEELAGKSAILLSESHRCAKNICAVASSLSRSNGNVVPRAGAPDGKAILLSFSGRPTITVQDAVSGLTRVGVQIPSDAALLTRRGPRDVSRYPWTTGAPVRFCIAVDELRKGDPRRSYHILSRELGQLLLREDNLRVDTLKTRGIDPKQWKRGVAALAFNAAREQQAETWNEWIVRVRAVAAKFAREMGLDGTTLSTKLRRAKESERQRAAEVNEMATPMSPITMTVHASKGREFDVVCLLSTKPGAHTPCPSSVWWSEEDGSEEREIAYVACTRAKTVLCLAVHDETFQALKETRPEFVALFEAVEVLLTPAKVQSQQTSRRRRKKPAVNTTCSPDNHPRVVGKRDPGRGPSCRDSERTEPASHETAD